MHLLHKKLIIILRPSVQLFPQPNYGGRPDIFSMCKSPAVVPISREFSVHKKRLMTKSPETIPGSLMSTETSANYAVVAYPGCCLMMPIYPGYTFASALMAPDVSRYDFYGFPGCARAPVLTIRKTARNVDVAGKQLGSMKCSRV